MKPTVIKKSKNNSIYSYTGIWVMSQKLNLTNKQIKKTPKKQTQTPQPTNQNRLYQTPECSFYRMTDSMNSNICSTRLSDEDTHPLWWIWAASFKMNSEEGKFASPLTVYFPTEVRIVTGIHPSNEAQLSEVMLLSTHTEKKYTVLPTLRGEKQEALCIYSSHRTAEHRRNQDNCSYLSFCGIILLLLLCSEFRQCDNMHSEDHRLPSCLYYLQNLVPTEFI